MIFSIHMTTKNTYQAIFHFRCSLIKLRRIFSSACPYVSLITSLFQMILTFCSPCDMRRLLFLFQFFPRFQLSLLIKKKKTMASLINPSKTRLSPSRTYPHRFDSESPPSHLALTSPPPVQHWSQTCHDTVLSSTNNHQPIQLNLAGGADGGLFVYLNESISLLKNHPSLLTIVKGGKIDLNEILLEIDQHKIAGCTLADVQILIQTLSINGKQIKLKTVKSGVYRSRVCVFSSSLTFIDLHNARRNIGDHFIKFVVRTEVSERLDSLFFFFFGLLIGKRKTNKRIGPYSFVHIDQ